MRAQLGLLARESSFCARYRRKILARRVPAQMHGQEGIPRAHRPSLGCLPICGQFDAMRFSIEQITEDVWDHEVRRRWNCLKKRRARLNGHEIVVVVVEGRPVKRKPFCYLCSIARLESVQALVLPGRAAKNADENGKITGPGEYRFIDANVP